jgi:hypothetical protein
MKDIIILIASIVVWSFAPGAFDEATGAEMDGKTQ